MTPTPLEHLGFSTPPDDEPEADDDDGGGGNGPKKDLLPEGNGGGGYGPKKMNALSQSYRILGKPGDLDVVKVPKEMAKDAEKLRKRINALTKKGEKK